jgi:hypothetical protein
MDCRYEYMINKHCGYLLEDFQHLLNPYILFRGPLPPFELGSEYKYGLWSNLDTTDSNAKCNRHPIMSKPPQNTLQIFSTFFPFFLVMINEWNEINHLLDAWAIGG